MNSADIIFPALSVFMAACTASYLWMFFYRPACFRFTISNLKALVWYKRGPGTVYLALAMLGVGFMFLKGIETALWWVPKTWTVRMEGEDRPLVWSAAV